MKAQLLPLLALAAFAAAPAAAEPTVVTDRAGLAAIADDLAGTYALGADIELAGTTFADCAAIGTVATVTSENADVGGLVGGVWNAPASFANCEAAVDVESPAAATRAVSPAAPTTRP